MLPEAAQGASRLLEALEKLSQWAGSGAGGDGPSGMPSSAAVQAFEDALNSPPEGGKGVSASGMSPGVESDSLPDRPSSMPTDISADMARLEGEAPPLAGPAEVMPSPAPEGLAPANAAAEVEQPFAANGVNGAGGAERADMRLKDKDDALMQELGQLLQDISQPGVPVGPEILFRAQYLVGMLKIQGQTGIHSSQQVSQGMENVLRQQG